MLLRLGRLILFLSLLAGLGRAALAANQCAIPKSFPAPRAIFPPPGSAVIAPITGYVLALSWSPQFCKENGDEKKHASQCKANPAFGFILHGLWPDGGGRNDPRWCKKVGAVPEAVTRKSFCATPSESLIQHEWAKHGSCISKDPATYYDAATTLFDAFKWPDMNALSRNGTTVGGLTTALAKANPGVPEEAISVRVTPLGWLEDVRICLDRDFKPKNCPDDIGGMGADARLKIWRGGS